MRQDQKNLKLELSRSFAASPEQLFEAWTTPALLMQWWGPAQVQCTHAEVDLRIGGRYRLDNLLPDGQTVIIQGEFLEIEKPNRLLYTWGIDPASEHFEWVTVYFEPQPEGTTVRIVHERITTETAQQQHAHGWHGCLDGLERLLS